jgi:hypothetical protein
MSAATPRIPPCLAFRSEQVAFTTPRGLTLACQRGSTGGLDRIGGSTELMRGDVRDSPGLARSVCGMPGSSTQVSGRAHGMTAGRSSLHHLHLTTHPCSGSLDRLPWP